MKIYFYKMIADNGGAPCVDKGWLSLAICKPMIRTKACDDDLVFGFAANSLSGDNRLIYVARIKKNLRDGAYYRLEKYVDRGDCIYAFKRGRFVWRKDAMHHGPSDVAHDLGRYPHYERANVLLSDDFRYFGRAGTSEYKIKFGRVKHAVESLGRGHRVHLGADLYDEFLEMKEWVWSENSRKKIDAPTSASSRLVCHRSRNCGVIEAEIAE